MEKARSDKFRNELAFKIRNLKTKENENNSNSSNNSIINSKNYSNNNSNNNSNNSNNNSNQNVHQNRMKRNIDEIEIEKQIRDSKIMASNNTKKVRSSD